MTRYEREIRVVKQLARDAGALAVRYREGGLDIDYKSGQEPVTQADHAASELILAGLRDAFPDDVHISEENADNPTRLTARRVWYIDPIDGTKDFMRGLEGFSVMIGLTIEHKPVLGVVYQPVGERSFWSDGQHAYWEAPEIERTRLTVSDVHQAENIRLVASKSHRSEKLDQVKSALGIGNEFNIGSVGLKLCLLALGERDLYVNPSSKCKSWDTCAPEAILSAAGGMMTDVHGDRLRYDELDIRRSNGLVASNGHVHAQVIDRMARLFPRTPKTV